MCHNDKIFTEFDKIKKYLKCTECQHVMTNPMICSNWRHLLCKECGINNKCSICNNDINTNGLNVKCEIEQCKWRGKLFEKNEHEINDCNYVLIKCKKCNDTFLRLFRIRHNYLECSK